MKSRLSGAELRMTSEQARVLAALSWCPQFRKRLIETADRMLAEADDLDAAISGHALQDNDLAFHSDQDQTHRI
jgi:hypothetical protein